LSKKKKKYVNYEFIIHRIDGWKKYLNDSNELMRIIAKEMIKELELCSSQSYTEESIIMNNRFV
jgi:hypothetical protein